MVAAATGAAKRSAVLAETAESASDPVVATVAGEPIHDSQIDRFLALEPAGAAVDPEVDVRQAALERLIDERLRFREIDRVGLTDLPPREVDLALEELRSGVESPEELEVDPASLRDLALHRRLVSIFVEERLDPRLFMDARQIRAYYDEVLTPELRARGEPLPTLDEAYATIRNRLKAEAFEAELARWTASLREGAEIERVEPPAAPQG